jgi:uncharacterized protein YkwD
MSTKWIAVAFLALNLALPTAPVALADDTTQQVVNQINATRIQNGLAPLSVSPQLTAAAQAYALEMANGHFFSHTAPDGSTMVSRDETAGYTGWTYLEENIAAGQPSPSAAVSAWLNSSEHRTNILSPNVRETGVGYAFVAGSPYGYYWVEEFGNRPGAASASQSVAFSASLPSPSWTAPTGHQVSGNWLSFLRSNGDVDNLGLPRTDVIADPTDGSRTSQFFQRAILEYHPENPAGAQIERRLLGDLLYPGFDPPVSPSQAPPGPSTYFPFSPNQPTGLGHFVADYTASGQPIYFKQYFDSHGGVTAFGFPKEEPKLRGGLWTQRFQAAVFEYHPEFDKAGTVAGTSNPLRNYRVQLELLGDTYIQAHGLPYH